VEGGTGAAATRIVGREPDLAVLQDFIAGDRPVGALVFTGEPGMGKTTLWEAGIAEARDRGLRVLSARPSDAESLHSFGVLTDLFDGIDFGALAGVPAPQRRALEVALLREDPAGPSPEPQAISAGCLSACRALAHDGPLLVAIDDLQWVDAASAGVLAFVTRRLGDAPIRLLLTRRARGPSTLERALEQRGLEPRDVGPLSLGALRRILFDRLGLSLPRRVLRRIFDASTGNPLFALELGRLVAERGLDFGEDVPVPDMIEDLLGGRVDGLSPPARRVLIAVALSSDLRAAQLARLCREGAVEEAIEAGVVILEGDRVRVSHPMIAAVAQGRARRGERRDLHLALANVMEREELRARHLVLAARDPDRHLAATVSAAARAAADRGAAEEAVELADHALRLTPPGAAERPDRLLGLAEHLLVAGDPHRLSALLSPELDSLPEGVLRGRAHLLLYDGGDVTSVDDALVHLDAALAHSADDAALRAVALAKKAECTALVSVERIRETERWTEEAFSAARGSRSEVERMALYGQGWTRALRGKPVQELVDRFHEVSDAAFHLADSPERPAAIRAMWRGQMAEARRALERLMALADQRGEAASHAVMRLHLCELELRSGGFGVARGLLDEWGRSPEKAVLVGPIHRRCRALLAAGVGLPDEAEDLAAETVEEARRSGLRWDVLEGLRARGMAALMAGRPQAAVGALDEVWEHTGREGVDDPGTFPVAADLVEALAEVGDHGRAGEVIDRLTALAEEQEHPWGLVTARRCWATLRLSIGHDEQAAEELEQSAADYGEMGLRFDRARCLFRLGRTHRRRKKWGAARRMLEEAAGAFEEIGSTGWAGQARAELARVGGRRARPAGELTPAERDAARLAAQGLSNKEIARRLFVTVGTVEEHLSRAYAKLGVRSRAQLVRRLSSPV
jgi:DNA-binding CsgD family transcriptional regulator